MVPLYAFSKAFWFLVSCQVHLVSGWHLNRRWSRLPLLALSHHAIKLEPMEYSACFQLLPAITSITFFDVNEGSDSETVASALRSRVASVLDANPWLAGSLQRRPKGRVELACSTLLPVNVSHHWTEVKSGCAGALSEKLASSLSLTESSLWEEISKATDPFVVALGRNCIDRNEPLFRVTFIHLNENAASVADKARQRCCDRVAVVVSMSHCIGDGATFYTVSGMLNPSRETATTTSAPTALPHQQGSAEYSSSAEAHVGLPDSLLQVSIAVTVAADTVGRKHSNSTSSTSTQTASTSSTNTSTVNTNTTTSTSTLNSSITTTIINTPTTMTSAAWCADPVRVVGYPRPAFEAWCSLRVLIGCVLMTVLHPKPKRVQWAPLSGVWVEALKKEAYAEGVKNEDGVEVNAETNAETSPDHAFTKDGGSQSKLVQEAGFVSRRQKALDFFPNLRHRSSYPKKQADSARFAASKAQIKRWRWPLTTWGMCRRRRRRAATKDIGQLYRKRTFVSTNDVVTAFLLREGRYAKAFMVRPLSLSLRYLSFLSLTHTHPNILNVDPSLGPGTPCLFLLPLCSASLFSPPTPLCMLLLAAHHRPLTSAGATATAWLPQLAATTSRQSRYRLGWSRPLLT
jgi:hypothetical protein